MCRLKIHENWDINSFDHAEQLTLNKLKRLTYNQSA